MQGFRYHPDIIQRFPNTVGGAIMVTGLTIAPSPPALQAAYQEQQQKTLHEIGTRSFSEFPSLAAWRSTFRGFGVDPTQYRSAPEALLRRLRQDGSIPFINNLVDIGNLISIRYKLPLAIIDTGEVQGFITVRFANGDERHSVLGESEIKHPDQGEVIFTDDANVVLARRWCWRQTQEAAIKETTTRALVVIEAQHEKGREEVRIAQGDMIALLNEHMNASIVSGILDRDRPSMP